MSCVGWYGSVIALAAAAFCCTVRYVAMHWSSPEWHRGDLVALLLFSAVALYRAALPTQYFGRKVWHDTPLSNLLAVRLLALVAELSFAWLVYRALVQHLPRTAATVVGCLLLAQGFSTAGTVTPHGMLFAVEETLWTIAALAGGVALILVPALRVRYGIAAGLVLYLGFQGWHLTELWKRHEAVTCSSYANTSNVRTHCDDYGTTHLIWAFVYFGLLPGILLYLHYSNTP